MPRHLTIAVLLALLLAAAGCQKRVVLREEAPPPPPVAFSQPAPMALVAAPPADHAYPHDDTPPAGATAEPRRPNPVKRVAETPVSTFSIDVDTGSYSRSRQLLRDGRLPPVSAVRTEEFLNYFDHGYPPPPGLEPPFSVSTELAPAPWHPQRHLLLVGIKGFDVDRSRLPPANLVFLIDTSGSMASPDKLPLLVEGFRMLAGQMRRQDRVAIVAYAGSAGLVLPSTPGDQRATILGALDQLRSGGATAGAAGIELAYEVARANRIDGGINRVILATDGDFNVGTRSLEALKALVEAQRASGIALTTLGLGRDHYNDALAEQLADIGNGNHAFIDDELEARKVLAREVSATLLTIARDVKIQLEFNPAVVAEYRLLGYENRLLSREQFADDAIDAGEIGAGHDVTALYEIVLVGSGGERLAPAGAGETTLAAGELARLRLRYKAPEQDVSRPLEHPVLLGSLRPDGTPRLQFAAAVAGFAELLRRSEWLEDFGYPELLALAESAAHPDPHGERAELVDLIELAAALAGTPAR